MKRATLGLVVLLFCLGLSALVTEINIDPQGWNLRNSADSYPVTLEPGQPMLPFIPVKILLPFGHKYNGAELSLSAATLVSESAAFAIANQQLPISQLKQNNHAVTALPAVENRLYPAVDWQFLGVQYYRGYQMALFNIYPYKYNPVTGKLYSSSNATITINSSFDTAEAQYQANFITSNADTYGTLDMLTVNPEEKNSYSAAAAYRNVQATNRIIDLSVPKKMIIITDSQRAVWFADYAAWRATMGVSNAIYTVEDIYASYPGVDNAEKVRNFIIHAYQTWSSSNEPLQYVILGGDDEIVPQRGAYGQVGDTVDYNMPVDLYFSNLDGNWNANNNTTFGESSDNTDLIPEVAIGRFPAQTITEFGNMFRKIQYYVNNDTFSNDLAIFMGENLNMNPVTWGGDYKDDVAQYLPDDYNLQTLYQRDGTYSEAIVWDAINNGAGIINHMGHANEFFLIGQSNNTIENLQNTEYGFLYSQGCYPAAFDQATSGDSESIAEHMVTAGGALHSFIGNTRYGWYMPGSIEGASQFYDRQFFNGMFVQNMPELGKALTYSRLQNLNSAMSNDVMRWCYYEVVLFGDPSVAVKAPDTNMPLLNLESYTFSDEEGDNDGTINPGEIIRLYPVVSNAMGWATAQNVSVRVESMPAGMELLGSCIQIGQIYPGGESPQGLHIRLQLPNDFGFGTYNLKIVVESLHPQTQLSTGVRKFTASFDITLMDNRFPWETPNAGKSAPLVGDFNTQPGNEILYADVYGNGYVIGSDGETINTFDAPEGITLTRSFASGPIDNEAGADLAFCSRNGDIYATSQSGENIFSYNAPTSFLFTPVLADINGDGYSETIAGGLDGKLYVVLNNGYVPFGFPLDLGSAFQSELAAADIDADGSFEIIAGTSEGLLYLIDGQGNIKPGFPVQLSGSITGAPTVTNTNKIVCATGSHIYIINSTGTILSTRSTDTHIAGGFAMGDVLNDNWGMDVVGVSISGMLYAFTDEGNDLPGFPVNTGVNFTCPPLLANLDDDPQLEILAHSYVNSVYGYNHDGSQLNGFPFITSYNGSTPATLVDFDGNNQAKLVMGHSNGVMMLNLRRPTTGLSPWITYRGDSQRQGSFASTGFVGIDDNVGSPIVEALLPNFPNPFNPSTTIRYSLPNKARALLEVFNLKGQKVCTLLSSEQPAGEHSIVWTGKDDNGLSVASGIYLYRLSTQGRSYQRRMLLLK